MPQPSTDYRFSFGPWNLSDGADPFGPPVRPDLELARKLELMHDAGFDAVMAHDDDVAPGIEDLSWPQVQAQARRWRQLLDEHGLVTEICAPRLWEDPRGAHGGFTSNDPAIRRWAIDRARRCADLCRELGTDLLVLWLAREGTYIREAKSAIQAHHHLVEALDAILAHDPAIRIAIEPKPNEPMDQAYLPTVGHALALASRTQDPARVGALIESAHSLLAGLDPSDDMAFALAAGKLWGVHLNDQNGLKYDQDKAFGAANLRGAFNQVRVLEEAGYAKTGLVAFDTKPMRTSGVEQITAHLRHSRRLFLALVQKVRTWDRQREQQLIAAGDYEALELAVLEHLMGL